MHALPLWLDSGGAKLYSWGDEGKESLVSPRVRTMNVTERLALEQTYHDQQSRQRAASFPVAESMRFANDAYLDHETWIRQIGRAHV